MRKFLFRLLYLFRIPHIFHYFNRVNDNIPILLFHDVRPIRNEKTGSITPDEFEKIILFLKKKYELSSLDNEKINSKSCIITFDDGMYNFKRFAYPVIVKHKVPVTLFVPPRAINEDSIWTLKYFQKFKDSSIDPMSINKKTQNLILQQLENVDVRDEYRLMNWNELKSLDSSLVRIHSHGNSHRFLTSLTNVEIKEEFMTSKELIETKIGLPVHAVAYPFGDCSNQVIDQAKNEFRMGFVVGDRLANLKKIQTSLENNRFHLHNASIYDLYFRISGFLEWVRIKKTT